MEWYIKVKRNMYVYINNVYLIFLFNKNVFYCFDCLRIWEILLWLMIFMLIFRVLYDFFYIVIYMFIYIYIYFLKIKKNI